MNKVVILIRNVGKDNYGGGETYQLLLADCLKRYGYTPVIMTNSSKLIAQGRERGFVVEKAPYDEQKNWSGWRNILFPIYFMHQLRLTRWYKRLFSRYRPVVVNIQSRDDWIAGTKAAIKLHIKVLWTDHIDLRTWVMQNVNKTFKNIIGKWILFCAKKVDNIVFVSDHEKEYFEKYINRGRLKNLVVIKNGVIDKKEEYDGVKKVPHTFCYIGRLVDYKGIRELLNAFMGIDGDVRLNIYGAGKKDYEKVGDVRIRFLGYTDEPLREMMKNEFFVLPSYYEGLSLSLLDAAMLGMKVIATDVDGNSEVIKNGVTGLLVPAKNEIELRNAMQWMLDHQKESNRMARNLRKKYEEEFDFEKIFKKQMLPLYKSDVL